MRLSSEGQEDGAELEGAGTDPQVHGHAGRDLTRLGLGELVDEEDPLAGSADFDGPVSLGTVGFLSGAGGASALVAWMSGGISGRAEPHVGSASFGQSHIAQAT
ncbi:hypothetical protein ASF71_21515 [Deinococcus sp. Leaf326]|nr:hypothetical protein ASF71_21515 [Deinococcus sp. Leaf326]